MSRAVIRHFRLLPLPLALLAGACTVGPNYRPSAATELGVPEGYVNAPSAAAAPQELVSWWGQFQDPTLDWLVGQALNGNLDLAQSTARLRQARESLVQARAGRLPTLTGSAGANETLDFDSGIDATSYSIGADASWEADLFGGISRSIEAARADTESAGFDLEAVRVALIGDIAANYVQLRLAQQRLAVAQDTLGIANDNLQIASWRVQAGLVSSLDQEQARSSRAQTAALIPNIESQIKGAQYRLSVLTGQAPGALLAALNDSRQIPSGPDTVAVGIPADTLRQRPDVRSAERSLASATARIGVAEAQLYPALRIGGSIGSSALSIGSLVDVITGSLFGNITQTIFDGGRLRSQVRSQEAAAEGAFAGYRQSVLAALEDVENGLVALEASKARQREFTEALDAATNQAILARSQYRAGLTDFQTLLDSERSLLSARDGLLSARADQALAIIQLYRALGGGWDSNATETGTLS